MNVVLITVLIVYGVSLWAKHNHRKEQRRLAAELEIGSVWSRWSPVSDRTVTILAHDYDSENCLWVKYRFNSMELNGTSSDLRASYFVAMYRRLVDNTNPI